MTSAAGAARVEPLGDDGAADRPTAETGDAGSASGGVDRPPMTDAWRPRTDLDGPAGYEGAK